jgi:AcrR family transcriptional regulator
MPARARILEAAFAAFTENGFANTSTLEIATRAHVSKRELYALVGNKQDMLLACISKYAENLRPPADLPRPTNAEELKLALASYGEHLLRQLTTPTVISVFRLAVSEATTTPAIAQSLEQLARAPTRDTLEAFLSTARADHLLRGDPLDMAESFISLLLGSLFVSWLLGVTRPLSPARLRARAYSAADKLLRLYAPPDEIAHDAIKQS